MSRRIALINPPYREELTMACPVYPLGLGYLQASCEKKGISCTIYDFSKSPLTDSELVEKYDLLQYEIIGVTTFSIDFIGCINFINTIKTENNIVIVGGHHATQVGELLLREFPEVDYVMKGYGEIALPQLVGDIYDRNMRHLYEVSGLCFRDAGKIIGNPIDYTGFNLDEFQFPNREQITFDYDTDTFATEDNILTISSSRGCPYNCSFCVNCKNSFWMCRSIEQVIEEINQNMTKKAYNCISFVDCNFFVDKDRAISILDYINEAYNTVRITFQIRADQICMNKEEIKKISEYNISVEVGIESCSESVLERYNKMTSPEINQEAIDTLEENGIPYVAYMIMFEALEDICDIRKNFNFIKRNKIYSYQNLGNIYQTLFPFYGCKYFDSYGKYYEGSIHHRTVPKFVHSDVEALYNAIYEFRNKHERHVNKILYKLTNKIKTEESLQIANKIILYHYGIFEYLLIMCEKIGTCNTEILYKSSIYNEFTELISIGEKHE